MLPPETELELDQPQEGELQYETLFGSTDSQGGIVFYPPTIYNQGLKPITRMSCSRYGLAHAVNSQNAYIATKDGNRFYDFNPDVMWENYLKVNPQAEKEGATLQSALEQYTNLGLITGYTRLNGIEEMKASLLNVRPIYTGSKNGNWHSVRDLHKYELGTGPAHIFCIIGYNESSWIAVNSYGISNGIFYIPFELTNTLFSTYSICDSRDTEVLAKYKN